MEVSASLVKTLREKTNVSIMECKKALQQANGNVEEAVVLLRKSGTAAAVKKQSRTAADGLVTLISGDDNTKIVAVEVNCETDFVAKNQELSEFANKVANLALSRNINNIDDLRNIETIETDRVNLVAKFGENIVLNQLALITSDVAKLEVLGSYIHGGVAGPSKILSIVKLQGGDQELAKKIAMHIAAMRPEYVSIADIPEDRLRQEEDICLDQTKKDNANKPEDIIKKIVAGRVAKALQEITLLDQVFIKQEDSKEITVAKLLAKYKAEIISVTRLEVGNKS